MAKSKEFFYPTSLPDLIRLRPDSMNKEKELDFEQRKINMEKDALKEEKSRSEKEKNEKFSEEDFDFKGENEELSIPDRPTNFKYKSFEKSARPDTKSLNLAGWANIMQPARDFYAIKKTDKPTEQDAVDFLKIDYKTHPTAYKLTKNNKYRKMEPVIKSLYEVSTSTLLSAADISKRAEIFAKLYMKYNYDESKYTVKLTEEEDKKKVKKSDSYGHMTKSSIMHVDSIHNSLHNSGQSSVAPAPLLLPNQMLNSTPAFFSGNTLPPPKLNLQINPALIPPNLNLVVPMQTSKVIIAPPKNVLPAPNLNLLLAGVPSTLLTVQNSQLDPRLSFNPVQETRKTETPPEPEIKLPSAQQSAMTSMTSLTDESADNTSVPDKKEFKTIESFGIPNNNVMKGANYDGSPRIQVEEPRNQKKLNIDTRQATFGDISDKKDDTMATLSNSSAGRSEANYETPRIGDKTKGAISNNNIQQSLREGYQEVKLTKQSSNPGDKPKESGSFPGLQHPAEKVDPLMKMKEEIKLKYGDLMVDALNRNKVTKMLYYKQRIDEVEKLTYKDPMEKENVMKILMKIKSDLK